MEKAYKKTHGWHCAQKFVESLQTYVRLYGGRKRNEKSCVKQLWVSIKLGQQLFVSVILTNKMPKAITI